jgi:hypothetical protein
MFIDQGKTKLRTPSGVQCWLQINEALALRSVDMALLTECGSFYSSAVYKHVTPIGVEIIQIDRFRRLA